LRDNGLDLTGIVSQGYNGASVMSGQCSGVQQRIRAVAPMALYIDCYARCLNLALLQRLSDTRWVCRYAAVDAVCSTIDSILATLQSIVNSNDRAKAVEASGIYSQIYSFKFLTTLIIFWRILSYTKRLSDHL